MTPHRLATVCFRVLATALSLYSLVLFVLLAFSRVPATLLPAILAFAGTVILYIAAPFFGRLAVLGLADDRSVDGH